MDGADEIRRYNKLVSDSFNHRDRWERMAKYIAPSRMGIINTYQDGQSFTRDLYDGTSILGAEQMAMFIASYTINPGQRWNGFALRNNPEVNVLPPVREYMEECRDRYLAQLAASPFYGQAPESLIDYVGFGTSCLFTEEATQPSNQILKGFRGFHVRAERTGRFVMAEGSNGKVDTVMREIQLTARLIEERWGTSGYDNHIPENVANAIREKQFDKPYKVVHIVTPRPRAEQGAGAKGMPWASCWIEKESKEILSESGYHVFPAAIARYAQTPGEVFGRGRGDIAFPDTWTLNAAKRMGLEDHALKLRPPILHSHNSVIGTLRLIPGGPTAVNTHGKPIRDAVMPFETGSRPDITNIKEEEIRRSIREIFYVDIIRQLLETHKSEMTAFEFGNKLQLLFRLLGPVYGRLEWEFLAPICDIGFSTMYHAGAFSPPPPELGYSDGIIDATFDNPINRAQRAGDAESLLAVANDLGPLTQIIPGIWDYVDADNTAKGIFQIRGLPASWTKSDKLVAQQRADREKQAQEQAAQAKGMELAQAAGRAAPALKVLQGSGPK